MMIILIFISIIISSIPLSYNYNNNDNDDNSYRIYLLIAGDGAAPRARPAAAQSRPDEIPVRAAGADGGFWMRSPGGGDKLSAAGVVSCTPGLLPHPLLPRAPEDSLLEKERCPKHTKAAAARVTGGLRTLLAAGATASQRLRPGPPARRRFRKPRAGGRSQATDEQLPSPLFVRPPEVILFTLLDCACHPCAGAMLIFSASFQF